MLTIISWPHEQAPTTIHISIGCNLCPTKKHHVIKADKASNFKLNKRTELISKCRHEDKYFLINIDLRLQEICCIYLNQVRYELEKWSLHLLGNLPLQHIKRPALKNKQVVVLRIALRARKVLGTFEKRTAGPQLPFFLKRKGILRIDQSVKMPLGLAWEL